jgi:uncharacterized membrane protein YjjP (DUF1212 family)/uncharacterized membrane protein YjjB (DUF3815 family)
VTDDRRRKKPRGSLGGTTEITGPVVRPSPRVGRVWRERAQWVVRGVGPPTVAIGLPGSDDAVSQRHARSVIDLALRVAEALLATGASAADVVATVLRLTSAYGVRSLHVDITFTSITISIHRGLGEDPLTVMRVIRVRSHDFSRLQAVLRLVDEVTSRVDRGEEPPDLDETRDRLSSILSAPHPYRRWVVTLGNAVLAAGVVVLFDAGPLMWLLAALSAAVVDRVQRRLWRLGLAAFFTQAVSAAIPTTVAVLLYWLESHGIDVPGVYSPSLVVISGIIVLLAGLTVMGAAQDALDGYYVTAGGRGLEMLMLTAGILAGISVVLVVANRLEVQMEIKPFVGLTSNPLVSVLAAVIIGIGFAMSTYTGPRAALVAAAVAGLGQLAYQLFGLLSLGQATTVFLAATVVGTIGYLAAQRLQVPEVAVSTAGIVSMLPGLAVYRALFWVIQDSAGLVTTAMVEFFRALTIGLGLAAGLSIGGFLARRRVGLDRAAVRALRWRQRSGPR